MKTKQLKRIRQRYKFRYNGIDILVVLDTKYQRVHEFATIALFLSWYVHNTFGFGTATSYDRRQHRRRNRRQYFRELKLTR